MNPNKEISKKIANDIQARLKAGGDIYGKKQLDQAAMLNDPRDWLDEAYEEALDLVFYLYAAIVRRDAKRS
tara:strand:- start:595 stop:807 length:213 start_codon:yes stop_codon:yes gene_type:complete